MITILIILTLAALGVLLIGFLLVVISIHQEERYPRPTLGGRPPPNRLAAFVRRLLGLYMHAHPGEPCDEHCPRTPDEHHERR